MRSRTIVSLALFVLVALALALIINRHGSQANRPAKVPELPKRLASNNSVRDSQAQSTQPLPSLQGKPARDYLKEQGLYVRLQNLIEAAQYQIDQQPQAQESSALRSELRKNNTAEIYEATNPAQNLRARFNGRDVVLQPLTNKRITTVQALKEISLLIDDTDAVYPLQIDPLFTQAKKLTASDAAANDRFGYSVATNGDTLVVGAYTKNSNTGAAYIFERNQGGAENWGQVQKLTPSDAAVNDQFGRSVAIDVDTVVVGAWTKNSNTGAAYIFKRNQGGVANWGQMQKLTASDAAGGDGFGSSVSINAETVVVGAWIKNSNTGAAYIFERNQGGAEHWGQVQKLTATDAAVNNHFGYSVSINGDTMVIGSHGKQPGAAYIFERNQGGPEHWRQVKQITASDGVGGDQFGISVAINNDTVAVGAIHGNRATSGTVYIFERNQSGVETGQSGDNGSARRSIVTSLTS